MSKYVTVSGTRFRLVEGADPRVLHELIEREMEDYRIDLDNEFDQDEGGARWFQLKLDGDEVGDSFPGRIASLMKAMAPFVRDPFSVQVREDSMSDDRDVVFHGGPSQEAIDGFVLETQVADALASIAGKPAKVELLKRLMADPEIYKPPQQFVTISGGVLTSVIGTQPLDCTLIDYDVDVADGAKLVSVPQDSGGVSMASVGSFPVEVNIERCAQLSAAADVGSIEAPVFICMSADGYWKAESSTKCNTGLLN